MKENIDIRKLRLPAGPGARREKNRFDFLNRDMSFGKAVSDSFREGFYTEMAILLEAGVDIRSALELILAGHKKKQRKLVEDIRDNLLEGATLSDSFKRAKDFSAYEYKSILIGEETGKLARVLAELALYFGKRVKQRRQLIGALTYPVVVLSVAVGAIAFMLAWVVPMFSDMYKRSGGDLPAITKGVIVLSNAIKGHGGIFFFLLASAIAIVLWQKESYWFRSFSARLMLNMPVWGKLIRKIYSSRFSSTMAMLLGARIPILQAIRLAGETIRFQPYEKALLFVENEVAGGMPLFTALSFHPLFPPKMILMVKVGEEVNELETFFKKLADQYASEVEHSTAMLAKIIEPLIIIVLGLIVGVILIAMYLPLFQLGQQL